MGRSIFGRAVNSASQRRLRAVMKSLTRRSNKGGPQWRVEQFRAIFARVLQAALDSVGKERRSRGKLKNYLTALPGLNFNDAVRSAFGAAKAAIKDFWTPTRTGSSGTSP